jgi:hypothetical protein
MISAAIAAEPGVTARAKRSRAQLDPAASQLCAYLCDHRCDRALDEASGRRPGEAVAITSHRRLVVRPDPQHFFATFPAAAALRFGHPWA